MLKRFCDRCGTPLTDFDELSRAISIFGQRYDLCDTCLESFRKWLEKTEKKDTIDLRLRDLLVSASSRLVIDPAGDDKTNRDLANQIRSELEVRRIG